MRRLPGILVVLSIAAVSAAPAHASVSFKPCRSLAGTLCGVLDVPLDRSGVVPGTVRLRVRRVRARRERRGAVFALSGGPGQSALPFTSDIASLFGPALSSRELVVFDQRGTGRSGLIRCPTLEGLGARLFKVAGAAADCASVLGARRSFYTTRDSVEDIETLRRTIGVERITLYAVSYGTKVALAYAARYPEHVERLVLDSIVELDGPDPFSREILTAIPRVLAQLCEHACAGITTDPTTDVANLVKRLSGGLIRGPIVKPDGQTRQSRLGRLRLFDLLVAGDFDPTLRSGFPGAVRSALAGDSAPLLRLADRADRLENEPVGSLNPAIFAATQCEEGPLPWQRSAPPAERLAQAQSRLAAVPEAALRPFDRSTAFFESQVVELCQSWPAAPVEPAIGGALPDVPALILSGEDDLRTPFEGARRVAALLPHAVLLPVPNTGHDVLDTEFADCSRAALRNFFDNRPVEQCHHEPRLFPPEPIAPTSLEQLPAAGGIVGRPGKTLGAVRLTLQDVAVQLFGQLFTFDVNVLFTGFGGLRGGDVQFTLQGIALRRVVYVPGVAVSGRLDLRGRTKGTLRVSGPDAAHGRLVLRRGGLLVGRLGGHRVRQRLAPRSLPRSNPFISRLRRSR